MEDVGRGEWFRRGLFFFSSIYISLSSPNLTDRSHSRHRNDVFSQSFIVGFMKEERDA